MIGFVNLIGRHSAVNLAKSLIGQKKIFQYSANIGAEKGYFTRYPVLKACDKLKTVCVRTVQSVRPSYIFPISSSIHPDLA
jgi:hypothetical protein